MRDYRNIVRVINYNETLNVELRIEQHYDSKRT